MMLVFQIESLDNDSAVLKDKNGQTVVWPKAQLPAGVNVGTELYFNIQTPKDLVNSDPKLAENILNEILHIS